MLEQKYEKSSKERVASLRYSKEDSKGFRKTKPLENSRGVLYVAVINKNTGQWFILNYKRRNKVRSGKATNLNYMKSIVRSNLIRLGVKLKPVLKRNTEERRQLGRLMGKSNRRVANG